MFKVVSKSFGSSFDQRMTKQKRRWSVDNTAAHVRLGLATERVELENNEGNGKSRRSSTAAVFHTHTTHNNQNASLDFLMDGGLNIRAGIKENKFTNQNKTKRTGERLTLFVRLPVQK
mmetsp:Transcript_18714/g.51242  ORF Transcript_18714/g.51242 Transcript_18714/m.51242 type:complete len:118 (+) Transcript_18714:1491-1844(+)